MKKTGNSLAEKNPSLSAMWAWDLNPEGMTPGDVSVYDKKEYWFRCTKNPDHVFRKAGCNAMNRRTKEPMGCVFCDRIQPFPGETDFLTECPEAREFWDYEKNTGLDPAGLFAGSRTKAWFTCRKGHSSYRKISDFCHSPYCMACANEAKYLINTVPAYGILVDRTRNKDINVDTVLIHDRTNVAFKCPNCGYEWSRQSRAFRERPHCPCCGFDGREGWEERNKDGLLGIVTIRQKHPDIIKYWDWNKNGDITPDSTTFGSGKTVHLICERGHSYSRRTYDLFNEEGELAPCPYCTSQIAAPGETDLFTVCPEAKAFWDFDSLENCDPSSLTPGSGFIADWKCANGHRFKKRVADFTKAPKCMECEKEAKSIVKMYPDLLRYWDHDGNTRRGLDPSVVGPYAISEADWICPDCGYKWTEKICDVRTRRKTCPNCIPRSRGDSSVPALKKGGTSLADAVPGIIDVWAGEDLNGDLTPYNLSSGSGKIVYLRCEKHPEYTYPITANRIPKEPPYNCPICRERPAVVKGYNDLMTLHPEVAAAWDYEKNKRRPDEVSGVSLRMTYHFILSCGHSSFRTIEDFIRGAKCSQCEKEKSVVSAYPQLARFWDDEANDKEGIRIDQTNVHSESPVHWNCEICDERWTEAPEVYYSVRKKGISCPFCGEHRKSSVIGRNVYKVIPEFMLECLPEKNLDRGYLTIGAHKKVIITCPDCGWERETLLSSRIRRDKNGKYYLAECSMCKRFSTYGMDEEIWEMLESMYEPDNRIPL